MRFLPTLLILALLMIPSGLALDANDLPVRNIYDPRTRQNEPIRDYTFWEIDMLLADPKFQQWNDLERVCDTMILLYGQPGHACAQVAYPVYDARSADVPPQVRAYVPPTGGHVTFLSAPRPSMYLGPPPWAYPPMPPRYHHPRHWR
jgi:hypothetical protein